MVGVLQTTFLKTFFNENVWIFYQDFIEIMSKDPINIGLGNSLAVTRRHESLYDPD